MDVPTHKTCTKCGETKLLDAFGNRKASKDGKQFQCLECKRAEWQDYAANRQDKTARKIYYDGYVVLNRPKIAARMKTYDAMRQTNGLREHQLFPERTRARSKAYYWNHLEAFQAYRAEHKEQIAANWARYAIEHAPELRAYQESHRTETNARVSAWAKANPERNAAREQRRRARKQNLPDTWTPAQLAFMLEYWHHSCAACGNPKGLLWTLAHDHWIPLSSPQCPGTVATNMIPLCHGKMSCNNSKNDSDPHEWLINRFGARKATRIESIIYAYFAQVALVFAESA